MSAPRLERPESGCPLVSIGIPVYNGGERLAEALESALAQEYSPLEIVVVDNASTDDTRATVERFAARDRRIRYIRNARNVGGVENARRALAESRGRYFTWLFHDDLICDPRFVRTVVEYLERNPDAAGCITGFRALNHELVMLPVEDPLLELHPDRPWPDVRREFFTWPQSHACAVSIFAMFRRAIAVQATLSPIRFRGRPIIYQWEMAFLADVCSRGPIVAVSGCMRAFRVSRTAAGQRLPQEYSLFDLMRLGLRTKLQLVRSAWRAPLPFVERMALLKLTVANLCRSNIRQPLNMRWTTRQRLRLLAELEAAIHQRSALVRSLGEEIEKRRAVIRASGREPDTLDAPATARNGRCEAEPGRHRTSTVMVQRGPIWLLAEARAWIRPASARDVDTFYQVNVELEHARARADELLREILHLHGQAEPLLAIINVISAPSR